MSGRSAGALPGGGAPRWDGDLSGVSALVVVVTLRGGPPLARCLDALADQRGAPRHRTLVVDNGGTAAVAEVLAGRDVEVVRSPRNLGFAGGANVGLRAARRAAAAGRWDDGLVLLVNDDAVPAADFVARMVSAHRAAPAGVGAFTGLLLHAGPDGGPAAGPATVNSTGTVITRRGSARDRDSGRPAADLAAAPSVFGFCGGAAGLRAACLVDVGVLADDWFLYYEDVDLSWRLRARGWDVVFVPDAVVWHEHMASSGPRTPLFRWHNDRNALSTFARHATAGLALRVWLRFLPAVALHALRPATRPLALVRLRAFGAALRRLPRTLDERRALWRDAASPRRDVTARWLDAER
ncbi:MAG: glycosyltransferase [Kineosporiaceae bacterium]